MGKFATMALAWLLSGATAWAQAAQDTPSTPPNSVKLTQVLADLPAGTEYLSLRQGLFCGGMPYVLTWEQGRVPQILPPFLPPFKNELQRAGYKVITPGNDNLFDEDASAADYEAAAVITDQHSQGCVSKGNIWGTARGSVKGEGSMKIDWQIYSRLKKQLVAHVATSGTSKLEQFVPGGVQQLVLAAFAENVRALAANADFRAAMNAPRPLTAGFQTPGQQTPIALTGSLKAGPRKIADAVGSVVTIMNDIGSGSGVLVSTDGYILTDAHVVGDDKEARLLWSDGVETLGQVVRIAKNRDVAILKTDPRDRMPLAIRRGPVTPGQRVYAIGSPKGHKFQSTVSSGIISADRVFNGLRYIQSDTMVSHGSSGGPLLDENGAVIGLTDLGISNAGPTGEQGQAGLNLFTPIGDAMDFLSLEQK